MTSKLILPMPGFEGLIPPDPGAEADLEVTRFGDGELRVRLHGTVAGDDCAIVGSVSPPGDSLLGLLLAAETLKAHGAHRITAVLPYLAYARSDIPDPGGVQSIGVLGRALEGAGIDEVLTVDVHSPRDAMLFPIPLVSLSPAGALAEVIASEWAVEQVIAPDKGAFGRARELATALGLDDPLSASQLSGTRSVLVVDDIVDTGRTLVECCTALAERDVEEIIISVTHPVFAGLETQKLLSLPVRALYTTDTILEVHRERPYLTRIVSVVPLLRQALAEGTALIR